MPNERQNERKVNRLIPPLVSVSGSAYYVSGLVAVGRSRARAPAFLAAGGDRKGANGRSRLRALSLSVVQSIALGSTWLVSPPARLWTGEPRDLSSPCQSVSLNPYFLVFLEQQGYAQWRRYTTRGRRRHQAKPFCLRGPFRREAVGGRRRRRRLAPPLATQFHKS
ncbi:hypothetical protein EVAR_99473_1 [Eumeta japonica]|uniref:Uncharacterized protein n=1 Tax=Eumeta variegata TaxID=151549 RepID=A0A4C1ZS29_EUMVA|nr:hypothetical protein EVAR_99473_1 [Eumeta japonica]